MSRDNHKNEARHQLEAFLFRIARGDLGGEGAVRDVVSLLFSLIEDVEGGVVRVEKASFEAVQRLEILERRMNAIPSPDDMEDIHRLVFGEPKYGLVGLLDSAKQTQILMGQLQRGMGRLQTVMMAVGVANLLLLLGGGAVMVVMYGG